MSDAPDDDARLAREGLSLELADMRRRFWVSLGLTLPILLLDLATPMSIMVGVGRGARAGVLIKDAKTLEVLEKVDTLIVDKTGTLTEGKPQLVSVIPSQPGRETELLRLAGSLERGSEHPLATAIVAGAQAKGLALSDAKEVRAVAGKGLIGTVDGRQVALGNRALMEDLGIMTPGLAERADAIRQEGQTVMFCATDGNAIGLLGVADPIKASTPEAIAVLHREGIRILMVTGDHRITAEAVARRLRIDEAMRRSSRSKKRSS